MYHKKTTKSLLFDLLKVNICKSLAKKFILKCFVLFLQVISVKHFL